MGLIPNDWQEFPLFVAAKAYLRDVDVVLDVGAGLRPQSLVTCRKSICVEPHGEYADLLETEGFVVVRSAAPAAFDDVKTRVDTVVMLDVIEHMEKDAGKEAIRRACEIARQQVVVFTPLGFMSQSGGDECDAWGMQGQEWQRHRSGWMPDDIPGRVHLVDHEFAPGHAAFITIWNRP